MRNSGYYSEQELDELGIQRGKHVLISRKVSLYTSRCEIGDHVRIDDFCVLTGDIKLGSFVHVGSFCLLSGNSGIIINDFTTFSSRVSLFSQSDDYSGEFMVSPMVDGSYTNVKKGTIIIEKFCLIGSGSIILPQVTLTEGTSVGSLSLVKQTTEAWSMYAGIPAKKIKDRHRNILELQKQFLEGLEK
jgi:galactoside O-acetyltransferase